MKITLVVSRSLDHYNIQGVKYGGQVFMAPEFFHPVISSARRCSFLSHEFSLRRMKQENKDGVKLGGKFVVVCCICYKTRNHIGKWVAQPYSHAQNSGVIYSHGLCPDCLQSQYGNELWYKQCEKDTAGKSLPDSGGNLSDRKKMLIIDDNSMIRTLLTADFEDDFKVEVAENGADGLVAARCWMPEVILLDINMPDMSGVEVMRRLESQCETKHIPVIVVTASEHNEITKQQLRPYGNFKGFFSKLTPSDEISKAVWRVLR